MICAMVKSRYMGGTDLMSESSQHDHSPQIAEVTTSVAIWGMVIPPLVGNPYNGYIKHYYKVDDHPYHRKTMGV